MAHIFQISRSNGGVPKHGVELAEVTVLGLVGDRQEDLRHHGGPDRAVCLYSLERLLELQSEGHPVFPGAMGENLTISGLDWASLQPGMRLRVGQEVLIEITAYTTPCSNLMPFFIEKDFSRVAQKRHPGWSRLYARVLVPGSIHVGDLVALDG